MKYERLYRYIIAGLVIVIFVRLALDIADYYGGCTTDTECGCTDDCLAPAR